MATNIINLDRAEVLRFCTNLAEPATVRPIITATPRRGLTLALDVEGARHVITENGEPYRFCSLDDVMYELDGAENVDRDSIALNVSAYREIWA